MTNSFSKCATAIGRSVLTLTLMLGLAAYSSARAGEVEAKSLLKAMSDYMASQNSISFDYDADYEVVTRDNQKIRTGEFRYGCHGPTR